ncbi:class I SAM-dependent methyltransferase [Dyadobacter tibetensis]|uniref:class I SAM-dependent methyltransferase n=1 Tax=Dyadobacter tibetensis TaxID=1211851 RepID=UPI0004724857|nr:hypothetical protein [Dyadobacter tibetensis]
MNTDQPLSVQPLSAKEIDFIQAHLKADIHTLMLQAKRFPELDMPKLCQQILSRQKAKKKLPEWFAHTQLVFPPPLSIEQASSEATALYKASLMEGESLLDITGGTGIDHYYMSKKFDRSTYCEINPEVSSVAHLNFKLLGSSQISVYHGDFQSYLDLHPEQVDWLYADPARRGTQKEKVVLLSDCSPDVVALGSKLKNSAHQLLIKTSPVLDIAGAVEALGGIHEVHIIGLGSECKELLFVRFSQAPTFNYLRKVRLLLPSGKVYAALDFSMDDEKNTISEFSAPQTFLYEPHAAVMKAGCYKWIGANFHINKIATSSHLYTSDRLVENFPGRTFRILAVCKPDAKEVKNIIKTDKANLTIRNFPGSVDDLRKKLRLKEGGKTYLFATTLENEKKVVIITEKIA